MEATGQPHTTIISIFTVIVTNPSFCWNYFKKSAAIHIRDKRYDIRGEGSEVQ